MIPKIFVVDGIYEFLDAFAAGHSEKDAAVVDERRFSEFDVGDKIFGRLAPVFDRLAEKTFPVNKNLIEIIFVDLLFEIEERGLPLASLID